MATSHPSRPYRLPEAGPLHHYTIMSDDIDVLAFVLMGPYRMLASLIAFRDIMKCSYPYFFYSSQLPRIAYTPNSPRVRHCTLQ